MKAKRGFIGLLICGAMVCYLFSRCMALQTPVNLPMSMTAALEERAASEIGGENFPNCE